VPDHLRVAVPVQQPTDWLRVWREYPASILVSGWQTPSLNSILTPADIASLQYVCYLAGSIRKLVPRELIANGLLVTNWGSSISPTVAECALMLTLMALRRASHWAVAMHRDGAWKDGAPATQSLIGKRVGIHGFGAICQALIPMLRPFTSDIQVYSARVPEKLFADHGVKQANSLAELFSTSDVVIELAALTPENHHIVDEKMLRLLPAGGVFVNVARGSIVDEAALVRVAKENKIQIALDVYEVEPLPADSPLRGLSNVTLLPHLGGPTRDRRCDSGRLALKNLRAYLQGQPLEAIVSLDVYDRST
jgi:phosphoglycerate dehydrogenase-like enzyme